MQQIFLEGFDTYDKAINENLNTITEKTKDILERKLLREKNENYKEYFLKYKNDIYINKKFISSWCKEHNNIIEFDLAIEEIKEKLEKKLNYETSSLKISRRLKEKVDIFNVNLFNKEIRVIEKTKFKMILDGIEYIKHSMCVNKEELVSIINKCFKGLDYGITEKNIFKFIDDNKLEIIKSNFIGHFYMNKMNLYPKITIKKVYENIKEVVKSGKVKLINMTFDEYFSLTEEEFNKFSIVNYTDILKAIGCKSKSKSNLYKHITRAFKYTDVKVIFVNKVNIYVSSKEFKEFNNFFYDYVDGNHIKSLGGELRREMAENNGIEVKYFKDKLYIKRRDVEKYIRLYKSKHEFMDAITMYDKFLVKIKYSSNKNNNYLKFKAYFLEFVRTINKSSKGSGRVHLLYKIYSNILELIEVDLEPDNISINNKLFSKVILKKCEFVHSRQVIIQFMNFLIKNKGFKLDKVYNLKRNNVTSPYKQEEFIGLLIKLIEVIGDKNQLKKIYRDWNLSSIISYIFMHYSLAWRKSDFVMNLPKPNLRVIEGVSDGESFIKWLEAGNEIDDKLAYVICRDIEETTNRLRKKANKNGGTLCCIISDVFYKEVATLLCINIANREIHFSKNIRRRNENCIFNKRYLEHSNMNPLLIKNFNIDLDEILEGGFKNIRMNKGFMTLVKEKAEELNLAYSYYYAQVARGHKSTDESLSETTKIYLQKDISRASVMAFSTGTMGSIAYTLLQLVDNTFDSKLDSYKIEAIKSLNMTPYDIENNVKIISNKISKIKTEIEHYLKNIGNKKNLLKEILYTQKSYGIDEKCKCLIKITREGELGINRIKSKNYKKEMNAIKWCPYDRKTCIGCEYLIALRYFIYEFDKKFNDVLNDLEEATTEIDKDIEISSINELYIPLINDLAIVIGEEQISRIVDVNRYLRLAESI